MAEAFRKRPVVIEAVQYNGPPWLSANGGYGPTYDPQWAEIRQWAGGNFTTVHVGTVTHGGPDQFAPAVRTLEGVMRISPGDWVIKGVKGEFYPCRNDIFEETYEPPVLRKADSEKVFNAVRDIVDRLERPRTWAGDWAGYQARRILNAIADAK